jgi:hypothetical protein
VTSLKISARPSSKLAVAEGYSLCSHRACCCSLLPETKTAELSPAYKVRGGHCQRALDPSQPRTPITPLLEDADEPRRPTATRSADMPDAGCLPNLVQPRPCYPLCSTS